jgi:acyl-CoA dehydrogenase
LVEWACKDLLYKMQERLHEVLDNFPSRMVAGLTTVLTFPTGRHYKRPDDELTQQLAAGIMHQSEARDRLTDGIYKPTGPNDPLAQLEDALARSALAEPALKKLRDAMRTGALPHGDPEQCVEPGLKAGIISQAEAGHVNASIEARRIAIQVDDFLPEYLTKESRRWENNEAHGMAGQSM